MKRLDLGPLGPCPEHTCHDCGEPLTTANYSGVEQIRQDGKTQDLCQNCYRRDDVVTLDELIRRRAATGEAGR